MYVVHDNAANAKLVLKSCSGVTQLFCLNHTLNLVVQGALKSTILWSNIKNLLRKTRKLAVQVKKSPKLTEELKSTCKSLKVKYVSLKMSIYNISNYFDPYSRGILLEKKFQVMEETKRQIMTELTQPDALNTIATQPVPENDEDQRCAHETNVNSIEADK